MDFEKQIKADRESLIQDIIKLVSINSVEAAPEQECLSVQVLQRLSIVFLK